MWQKMGVKKWLVILNVIIIYHQVGSLAESSRLWRQRRVDKPRKFKGGAKSELHV